MKKWLPWILTGVFALWVLAALVPQSEGDRFHVDAFGRLPVLLNGRVQPFDSVARNSLLSMRGKQTVAKEKGGHYISATEWLLNLMLHPEEADQYKSFRIQHPDVQGVVGVHGEGLEHLSFNDLAPYLSKLQDQATPIVEAERDKKSSPEARTPYQKDLMHLYSSLMLYNRLKNSIQPEDSQQFVRQLVGGTNATVAAGFSTELELFRDAVRKALPTLQKAEKGEIHDQQELQPIFAFFRRYQDLDNSAYPLIVPPQSTGSGRDDWRNVGHSLLETMRTGEIHPALPFYASMASAYASGRPAEFNQALSGYEKWLNEQGFVAELNKGRRERFFNHMEPFYKAMVIYVAALLLGCASWLGLSPWVRRSAAGLLVLAFVVHTVGLVFRMVLEGRPPVTNLYSSAIFVGWGAVLLGIILERIYKDGIGTVAAAAVGFSTQIIAHHLALGGDTMEMLRAVLDTNFWLATHVVMITAGYSSMFFAGFLAVLYVVRGFFTRSLTPVTAKSLNRMVYGIVCFSTLFSFVGTVLGGIWADQSWGRFWGWDPKENGALLIVIWCAVILHARWSGMVRERGLMALAIFGNIVTSFSWFGVNMLGVGLHSYGFMDKAFQWLMAFIVSQVILICITMVPERYWLSFRADQAPGKARKPRNIGPEGATAAAGA